MKCNWVRYFGDYCFKTECGHFQGINIRPKQKTCYCGKRVNRLIQDETGVLLPVTSTVVNRGIAYYYTD